MMLRKPAVWLGCGDRGLFRSLEKPARESKTVLASQGYID